MSPSVMTINQISLIERICIHSTPVAASDASKVSPQKMPDCIACEPVSSFHRVIVLLDFPQYVSLKLQLCQDE